MSAFLGQLRAHVADQVCGQDAAMLCVDIPPATGVTLQGQAYADAGATAYDAVDGAISSVTVSGGVAVNTMAVSMLGRSHTDWLSICYIAV